MAITNLERRTSKLEDAMDYLKRQKETEERKAWREANSERLNWEMFLRVHGPESVEVTEEDLEKTDNLERKEEIRAEIAYKKLCQKVLSHYAGWIVKYENMDETEKAFAYLLELFYAFQDTYSLFELDLDHWQYKLGFDETRPPFVEFIRTIDEHMGGSDWREVCYLQESQDAIMERLFQNYEAGRARYLRYKSELPNVND